MPRNLMKPYTSGSSDRKTTSQEKLVGEKWKKSEQRVLGKEISKISYRLMFYSLVLSFILDKLFEESKEQ